LRGPSGNGVATEEKLPQTWSTSENVRWRVDLPERGNSSPIVWGDRVFVTQAVGNRRTVICFNRADGKQLWQSGPTYTEQEQTQRDNPYCSATPVTDGERVVASFGSAGLYCYDLDGKELWHRGLGKMQHMFGNAASPILAGDLCVLNFGPGENSRLIAVNKKTGETAWEAQPPKVELPAREGRGGGPGGPGGGGASWSTPIVINVNGREELIVSLPGCVAAYDPKSGQQLWMSKGLGGTIYTSPVAGENIVFGLTSGPGGGAAIAVKPGGSGDVSEKNVVWKADRFKSGIGSGVIREGHLYTISQDGIAACTELQSGKPVWEERLKSTGSRGSSWSSMILAGDRIYVPNQNGDVFVLRAAPQFELLATNSVGESTNASLAAADGELFLRTDKALWCFKAQQ
jgi:outer membrane protein assembly factor BamB